jgi:hypothetical protein
VFNQNAAHNFRDDGKELRSLLPAHLLHIDEPQVCFMYQCGCLYRVSGTLATQAAARDLPQLGICQIDDSC